MSVVIVRETVSAVSTFSVPNAIASDEARLRNHLEGLTRDYPCDRSFCFWTKLTGGRLKAFFRMANGIESRTYTTKEVTDAIFHKKPLFFHPAAEIVGLLEEPILAVA